MSNDFDRYRTKKKKGHQMNNILSLYLSYKTIKILLLFYLNRIRVMDEGMRNFIIIRI
jgi:hypothetical protein